MKDAILSAGCRMLASLLSSVALILLSPASALAAWPHILFPTAEGITLVKGVTYTIQWGSVQADPVNILLCTENIEDGLFCFQEIAVNVPNSGSYPWTVPANLPNGSDYVIGVGVSGVSIAFSDNTFRISDSTPASWSVGAWGSCNAPCDGGVKTRDVVCIDPSGITIPESYCSDTRPSSTESCNTHACQGMSWLPLLLE